MSDKEQNEDTLINDDDKDAIPENGNQVEENEQEIQELSHELAQQKDKYIRLFAEFENFKKRSARESIETRQTAAKDLITDLLEVLDDMDRAEQQMKDSKEPNPMEEGILLIFNKFRRILELRGLKSIETLHTDFDVEKDEAVSEIPVEDEELKGKVVAEVQKGYLLNEKLIRFAKVVVGK